VKLASFPLSWFRPGTYAFCMTLSQAWQATL